MKAICAVMLTAVILLLSNRSVFSQHLLSSELAQLTSRIKSRADDTQKVDMLLKVGEHLLARAPIQSAVDSATSLYNDVERISNKIKYDSGVLASIIGEARIAIALREDAVQYGKKPEPMLDQIYALYHKVIDIGRPKRTTKQMGNLYFQLAQLAPRRPPYADYMQALYDSSAACFRRAHERDLESISLKFSGQCFHAQGKFDSAAARYRKSIDVMRGATRKDLSLPYSLLGNIYLFQGDTKRALDYFHKASDLASAQDSTGQAYGLVNMFLGLAYEKLQEYDLQLRHYRKAMHIYEPLEKTNPGDLLYATNNTAATLVVKDPREAIALLDRFEHDHPNLRKHPNFFLLHNNKIEAYYKLKDYATAQRYYDSLASLPDKRQQVAQVYPTAINLFIATNQFNRAEHLLKAYREGASGQKARQPRIYYLQFRLDSAKGNYRAAIESYIKYKTLNDSLLDEAKVKEIAQLNIAYETNKKEQSIALLKQDTALQTIALREAKFVRNGIIGGTALLAFVLALVYNLYRDKKKANEELAKQKDEIALKHKVLERVVGEKEWLLKEVHHRVKNNLHMISGLLSMQAHELRDSAARSAILDSQNRVYAMSIVHQKLYSDERLSFVNFSNYVTDLVDHIRKSLDTQRIRFNVSVSAITVDAHMAISLGLVINEAITNSIKHAFPNRKPGLISISLHQTENDSWKLTVYDDGIGISNISSTQKSIGMTLIEGITEELGGTLQIDSSDGFNIRVTFPYHEVQGASIMN